MKRQFPGLLCLNLRHNGSGGRLRCDLVLGHEGKHHDSDLDQEWE